MVDSRRRWTDPKPGQHPKRAAWFGRGFLPRDEWEEEIITWELVDELRTAAGLAEDAGDARLAGSLRQWAVRLTEALGSISKRRSQASCDSELWLG